jgi:hypothetical protein
VYSGVNGSTVWGIPIKPLSLLMPTNQTDQTINAGAEVTLGEFKEQLQSQNTDITTNAQAFVSSTKYVDIQEWFYEDGIYNLFYQSSATSSGSLSQSGSNNVFFRMGTINFVTISSDPATVISAQNGSSYGSTAPTGTSIYMMISTNLNLSTSTSPSKFIMYGGNRFKIVWQKNIICLETVPKQNESPIYHECTDNLSILTITPTGGLPYKVHGGNVPSGNQSTTQGATVALWTNVYAANYNLSFNCWAFANGVESNRIRDDFNAPTMEWSPRVFTPVENYKQETVYAGVTYSGTYNYDSPSNNLNQFNLSLGNFKQLDKSFGSVQRIKSRDTDLVVLQQDKVSKVLFGKNLLSDSAGGGSISSIPEVLGTQVAYEGQFGISNNPESFAQWGDDMYFTDSQRGAVLRLNNQGLFDISTHGMKSFFNHNFKIQPDTIKIGAYDPYYKRYVLRETDRSKGSNSVTVVNTGGTTPTQAYTYVPFQEPITAP